MTNNITCDTVEIVITNQTQMEDKPIKSSKVISFYLKTSTIDKLEKDSKETTVPKSKLVQKLLEDHFNNN